jgi:hypothetical protein
MMLFGNKPVVGLVATSLPLRFASVELDETACFPSTLSELCAKSACRTPSAMAGAAIAISAPMNPVMSSSE